MSEEQSNINSNDESSTKRLRLDDDGEGEQITVVAETDDGPSRPDSITNTTDGSASASSAAVMPQLSSELWATVAAHLTFIELINFSVINKTMLREVSPQIESITIDKPAALHPQIARRFTGVQSVTTRCLFRRFTGQPRPHLSDETVAKLPAFLSQLPNLSDVYLYGIREYRSQPGGAVNEITAKSPYDFRTIVASSGMPQGARPVMNEMGSTFMKELVRTVCQLYSTDAIPATTTFHGLLDHQICSTAFISKHSVPRNIACAHCERVCLDFPVEQLKNSLICERYATRYHNDPDERTICLPPNLALNLVAAGNVGDGDSEGSRREALVDAKFFLQSIVNERLDLAEAIVDHDLLPGRITRHEIEEVFGEWKPAIAEPLLLCLFEKGVPFRGADFSSITTETRPENDFDDDDESSEELERVFFRGT